VNTGKSPPLGRTFSPANLNVCIGQIVVGEGQVAEVVEDEPVLPTGTAARSIRLCLVKCADVTLGSPGGAVEAFLGEQLTTRKEETSLPEMVFLSKVGEHLTQAVLLAVPTALFYGLNTGDNVDDVLLQDVALAGDSAWTLCRARDTLLTGDHLVTVGLREEGAGERKNRS